MSENQGRTTKEVSRVGTRGGRKVMRQQWRMDPRENLVGFLEEEGWACKTRRLPVKKMPQGWLRGGSDCVPSHGGRGVWVFWSWYSNDNFLSFRRGVISQSNFGVLRIWRLVNRLTFWIFWFDPKEHVNQMNKPKKKKSERAPRTTDGSSLKHGLENPKIEATTKEWFSEDGLEGERSSS